MQQPIRAVIFDMYETLVTQFCSPLYYGTQIAQDLGLAPEDFLPGWRKTDADRATGKLTFEEVIRQLMQQHGIYTPEEHRRIVGRRMDIQADCFRHLHPQVLPLLAALKERGLAVGLISNCFGEEAALIRHSALFPYFDAACLSYELGIRKPDTGIFFHCLRQLQLPAESCLYVGDGGSQELETARSLGMQAVQATWYRQEAMEAIQAALRPEFPQAASPLDIREFLG